MNNFFYLSEYCYIVEGKEDSLIYDLKSKRVFSFDEMNSKILKCIDEKNDIEKVKEIYAPKDVDNLINGLLINDLGRYSEKIYFKEKYRMGKKKKLLSEVERNMNTAFIELPAMCTQNCTHCNTNKHSVCETCNIPSICSKNVDINFYEKIIKEITNLNFRNIIFHGGDPLTLGDKLNLLLEYTNNIKNPETKILIKTNGSLLNNINVKEMIRYNAHPIIVFDCVGYSKNKIIKRVSELEVFLNRFEKENISYYANIVLDKESEKYGDEICDFLNKYKFKLVSKSLVVEFNSIPNSLLKHELYYIPSENFEDFKLNNKCLNNNIAITSDKKVTPCPGLKDEVIIDLSEKNILQCFEGTFNIDNFWKMNLDSVENCSECKFRYSCRDCRYIEKAITGKIQGKKLCEKIY